VALPESVDITSLLKAWGQGDQQALEQLTPLVYSHLRAQARRCMRNEHGGVTLESTALVHEAYLRLVNARVVDWHDRVHFFALSARIMRRILIDAARARAATKRGGAAVRADHSTAVDLDQIPADDSRASDVLCALDDALESLGRIDARRAQVIELRFFGGLSVEETAEVLAVSPQTVMRDWRLARAWLARELRDDQGEARGDAEGIEPTGRRRTRGPSAPRGSTGRV
jgi:RNA polymerase sigma factor (TIGR02999 family)